MHVPDDDLLSPTRKQRSYLLLCGVVGLITAHLIYYSQTAAFAWDEGFHLLTAQLMMRGKTPYLDFCFPQTLLNAYWNALWFRVFGDTWHTAHAVAALMTAGAVWMTADYVYMRFPVPRWRTAAAFTTALAVGLNVIVVGFGTVGQAYGFCLFVTMAAFRLTVVAVERRSLWLAAVAGLFAGAGPGASLLTTWVCPVLGVWMLLQNRAGHRWAKFAVFSIAAAIPFLPVVWLFVQNPAVTRFNVIDYHLLYRQVKWEGAIQHDVDEILSFVDSGDALVLGLLSLAGLLFIRFRSEWPRSIRAQFYLCAWLAIALSVQISSAHPTFRRYYLLTVPFVSIIAMAGLYFVSSRLYIPDRPVLPNVVAALLFILILVKTLHEDRHDFRWSDLDNLAARVNKVTPPNGLILGDEQMFFITRRPPPFGMELSDSHKLEMPPALAAARHILPGSVLEKQVKAGRYATIQVCGEEDPYKDWGLDRIYHKKVQIEDCTIYWNE